jgi:hypothetical protein
MAQNCSLWKEPLWKKKPATRSDAPVEIMEIDLPGTAEAMDG